MTADQETNETLLGPEAMEAIRKFESGGMTFKPLTELDKPKLGGIKFPKKLIPSKNKPEADKVYTPDWLAEAVVNHYKPWGKCLEPCAGGGAFVRAMKKYGVASVTEYEIDRGQDFLLTPEDIVYDWSISNWPWSKFRPFLQKNLRIAKNIVTLTTINHIFALKARLRDIKEAGFFIEGTLLIDTPPEFPQSGFQLGAIHLTRTPSKRIFSYL